MKNLFFLILFFSLIVFTSSCKKFDPVTENDIPKDYTSIKNNSFSPSFDWETTRIVDFTITCPENTVIDIQSADGKVRYHRCMHLGKQAYKVKLSIPYIVKQLKINDQVVDVDSKNINFIIS